MAPRISTHMHIREMHKHVYANEYVCDPAQGIPPEWQEQEQFDSCKTDDAEY